MDVLDEMDGMDRMSGMDEADVIRADAEDSRKGTL